MNWRPPPNPPLFYMEAKFGTLGKRIFLKKKVLASVKIKIFKRTAGTPFFFTTRLMKKFWRS